MKRYIPIFCSILALSACASSTSSSISYYLLDSSEGATHSKIVSTKTVKPLVLLETVALSEFLAQSSLVLRLDNHRLHSAQYHVWAEPLTDAIAKALLKDLRHQAENYHFEQVDRQWQSKEAHRLRVQIDQFYPTAQKNVLITGRYWIKSTKNGSIIAQDFAFTQSLTEDGYTHAVTKMRVLVTTLATGIVSILK